MTDIVTREQAKQSGAVRYFTGKPCAHGHVDFRFTSIGSCVACSRVNSMKKYKHTTNKRRKVVDTPSLIREATQVHGDKYTYDRTVFISAKQKVVVTCKAHGDFETRPDNLIHGKGCRVCKNEGISRRCNAGREGFIAKSQALYGDVYDYKNVDYVDSHTKVEISCKIHGAFWQTPTNHLTGKDACAGCNHTRSRGEAEIADFRALIESRAADHAIWQAKCDEAVFELPHLERCADQDRDFVERMLLALKRLDLIADRAGLFLGIPRACDGDLFAQHVFGVQRFAETAFVVRDDVRGGGEDMARRAVVALQPDHLRSGEVVLEPQDVIDLGAAPAVDRLVVVADAANVLWRCRGFDLRCRRVGLPGCGQQCA